MSQSIQPIEQWILSHHPEINHLPTDIDLIENRLIDSLRFMEFIFFLETLSGQAIDITQIQIDDFRSMQKLADKFCVPITSPPTNHTPIILKNNLS